MGTEPQKRSQRKFYAENREKVKREVTDRRSEMRAWIRDYKETLSCFLCGESESCCLAFHHRDPSDKDIAIANAISDGWGKERIMREIEKCDVLCHNCHSKIHAGVVQR